jgi:VWFA-related protein
MSPHPKTFRALPAFTVLLISLALSAAAPRAAAERDIFVSVVNDKKEPVEGLAPGDFVVREDGVAREVLRVEPATAPMQIALLIDDSAAADSPIKKFRDGAKAFVKLVTAAGKNQIAVITFGERSTLVRDYTTDAAALSSAIDRIFARSGTGMQLLDALVDASRGLAKRETPERKHIVVIMTEGTEFSTLHHQNVLDAIHRANATMHALVLTSISASDITSEEIRTRNQVLDLGTRTTGGRRDNLLADMSVEPACASLARELLNQYRVVYARPDTLVPPERLEVTVKRPGVDVRAPTRAPAPQTTTNQKPN